MRPRRVLTTVLSSLVIASSALLGCARGVTAEPDACFDGGEVPASGCVDPVQPGEELDHASKPPAVDSAIGPPDGPPATLQPDPPGTELGAPLEAPASKWTWFDFPDSVCANGNATGIGVNPSPSGGPLLIVLQGGGSCVDEQSCWIEPTAINIATGFGKNDFEAMTSLEGGFFDRGDVDNPFANASFVFVPYCTGDAHMGSRTVDYGTTTTHHRGYDNLGSFLARLVPTFPGAPRVILAGSSAGGYGAAYNWYRTQQMFGDIAVDLIDDSGPWLPAPYLSEVLEQSWRSAWNLDANWPLGCGTCLDDLDAIYSFSARHLPASRGALLSYVHDAEIANVFGLNASQMGAALEDLVLDRFSHHPNLQAFVVAGDGHILFDAPQTQHGATSLKQWLAKMANNDTSWSTLMP